MQSADDLSVPLLPSTLAAPRHVLSYGKPVGVRFQHVRETVALAVPVVLTAVTLIILIKAVGDSDPFDPGLDQSSLYLASPPVLVVLWGGWAVYLAANLLRRQLKRAWGILWVAGVAWAGLLCFVLYCNAAQYIDQTTKIRGASWPIVGRVYKR